MTDARKDGIVPDPSQIAEMQVTDATLDRLAARAPEPGDLDDPVYAALAGLASEVDVVDTDVQDEAVARLIEVLDGRPLWVLDGEDLAAGAAPEMILLDDPAWEEHARQVIDLRRAAEEAEDRAGDPAAETVGSAPAATAADGDVAAEVTAEDGAGAPDDAADQDQAEEAGEGSRAEAPETVAMPVAARTAADAAGTDEAGGAGVVTPLRRPPGRQRSEEPWVRALRRVSLPAAAAVTLFTLGGGITAALTGDPMAPLDGVSRVVDSIAGTDNSRTTYSSLEQNLEQARTALANGDLERAQSLLAKTQSGLDEIPEADKQQLQQQLEAVQNQIASAPNAPSPAPSVATGLPTAAPSPEVSSTPTATSNPEPSETESSATAEPSETPSATPTPSETGPSAEPSTQEGATTGAGTGSTGGAAGGTGNSSDE
jgi:hypothetical protein